jgi:tRNA pseudouridine55 synthase
MNGILVVDKPAGVTSHAALAPVKRAAGRGVKVGHAGTLDPFATGVLVVLVGDGTRLAELAMGLPKEYVATVRFGRETDTLDTDGAVVREADPGTAPPAGFEDAVARFVGEIEQVPPRFSALKVGGRRAHRIARAGGDVELRPRTVSVHSIEVLGTDWPEAELGILCGAGTYVRALARDLGAALGLPASLSALRRTRIGPFTAAEGLRLDEGAGPTEEALGARLRPLGDLVRAANLAVVRLDPASARDFVNGGAVPLPGAGDFPEPIAVEHEGTLLGLGRADGDLLRPARVLHSAQVGLSG